MLIAAIAAVFFVAGVCLGIVAGVLYMLDHEDQDFD